MIKSNELHAKYLSKFVEAQAEYYEQANKHLYDLLNNKSDESHSKPGASAGFATLAALSDGQSIED